MSIGEIPVPAYAGSLAWLARLRALGRRPGAWLIPVVGYGLPAAAALAVAVAWFRPGRFIASGDVTPFLRDSLSSELFSAWSHQLTGAGSESYEMARALEVGSIWLAGLFGGSAAIGQLLLLGGCFALAAVGASHLAGAFVRHPAAICAAGFLGAFNAYVLVNHPNPLPLLALGVTGILTGEVWRRAQGRPLRVLPSVAALLLASYLAVNPPLLVLTATTVAGAVLLSPWLFGAGAAGRTFGFLALLTPLALLLSLWWLVPFLQTTVLTTGGLAFAAETDVQAWAWSHARASLENVASLNGQWGWAYPEYFPYAAEMERGVWPVLRWLLPAAAAAGVLLARPSLRRAAWTLAAVALGLIFLAKGLHAPLAGANLWLFEHVPGLWLFREPMSKLGVGLVLVYSLLAAFAVERSVAWRRGRAPGTVAAVIVLAAALAYPWPLWTGAVVPDERPLLPSAHVRVPDEWHAAAAAVNRSPVRGKALVLPLASYYQVTTSWGYHGASALPGQLLLRPVLQRAPGSYFENLENADALMTAAEGALAGSDAGAALRLLQALGVSHVVVRHDLVPDVQNPALADPERLDTTLAGSNGVRRIADTTVVDVFELEAATGTIAAYSQLVAVGASAPTETAEVVARLPPLTVSTGTGSVAVDAVSWTAVTGESSPFFWLGQPGPYRVREQTAATLYRVAVRAAEERSTLELVPAGNIAVDGLQVKRPPPADIALEVPEVSALDVNGRLVDLAATAGLVALSDESRLVAYAQASRAPAPLLFTGLEDCNAWDERTPAEAGLTLERPDRRTVRLGASAHSACTWAPVPVPTADLYRIELEYRVERGAPARLCLWQEGPATCAALPAPSDGDGWRSYRALARTEPGSGGLRLYVYADGDVPGGTLVAYRDVSVQALRRVGGGTLTPAAASDVVPLASGRHRIRVEQPTPAISLGPLSDLEDCGASDARTPSQAGLRLERHPDGVIELRARAHIACAWASAGETGPAGLSRVSLEHRTLSGRPARICVWQVGPDRCAELPQPAASEEWQLHQAVFRPEPGTRELRLYLYADGQESPETVIQYRAVALEPASPITVELTPAFPEPEPPSVSWSRESPARYLIEIRDARGPFVLVLAESYAPGWTLGGLPVGWKAEHLEVDGYANGWRIDGSGDAALALTYEPAATARAAGWASLLALGATGVSVPVVAGVRRRRRVQADASG